MTEPSAPDNATPAPAAPAATPAAPAATPAPASTPVPAAPPAGPPSAARSLEKVSSAASSAAAPPAPVPPPPAGATAQPGARQTRGPIPFDRHEAALRNAREQSQRQVLEQYGLPPNAPAEDVRSAVALFQQMRANPAAFAQELLRRFGPAPAAGPAGDDADPEPDLVTTDGKKRGYSADAMRKIIANEVRRAVADVRKEYAPALEYAKEGRQQQEVESIKADARKVGSEVMQTARTYPHFQENEDAIAEKLAAMNPQVRKRMGAIAALHFAYVQVLQEKVFPTLSATAEQNVLDDLKRKAAATDGSVSPNGASSGVRPSPKNPQELSAHLRRLSGAG